MKSCRYPNENNVTAEIPRFRKDIETEDIESEDIAPDDARKSPRKTTLPINL